MQLAKVRGTVVSTQKVQELTGMKFLLVQYIDEEGQELPAYEVAGDIVGAGANEWVLVTRGSAARQDRSSEGRPLDALVVAIVDTVTLSDRRLYSKKDEY
jgi:carbon dioxide concentrating mechanism protein CcmL